MEDDFEIAPAKKKSARKLLSTKSVDPKIRKAQKQAMLSADLFASAEEFSALIDENEREEEAGGMEQVKTWHYPPMAHVAENWTLVRKSWVLMPLRVGFFKSPTSPSASPRQGARLTRVISIWGRPK